MLNNTNAGVTPFESKVKDGVKVQVKLKKKNYEEWVQNITVKNDVNINAKLDFTQEYKDALAAQAKKQKPPISAKEETGLSSTWWWIGGGVVVAGAAAAILLSSEGEEPPDEPSSFPAPPGRP